MLVSWLPACSFLSVFEDGGSVTCAEMMYRSNFVALVVGGGENAQYAKNTCLHLALISGD